MGGYADHRKDTEVNNKVLMTNKAIIPLTMKIKLSTKITIKKVLVAKKKRELELAELQAKASGANTGSGRQSNTASAASGAGAGWQSNPASAAGTGGAGWQSLRAASAAQSSAKAWDQWRAQARSEKANPKKTLNPETLDYNLVNVQKPEKREDSRGQQGWAVQDVVTTKPFENFIFVTENQNRPASVKAQVRAVAKRPLPSNKD